MDYEITKAKPADPIPNHLLLLGDENQQLVDAYLPSSEVFLLKYTDQILGICVVKSDGTSGEIMNVAVEPGFQGQGLGKAILREVIQQASKQGMKVLTIKTGNSGIGQIALYQRLGFDLVAVNYNYFLDAYPEPIWENNIQCKHQLVFELALI